MQKHCTFLLAQQCRLGISVLTAPLSVDKVTQLVRVRAKFQPDPLAPEPMLNFLPKCEV